jgi:hypothetical protein
VTQTITKIVAERKKDIDEQSNVERERWIKEFKEFYESKISYYEGEIKRCEGELRVSSEVWRFTSGAAEDGAAKIKNEISGYNGTITRLKRERDEKLAELDCKCNVSITRKEVSACYIVIV